MDGESEQDSMHGDDGGDTTDRPVNAEMAQAFDEIAHILEIKGEQGYRVNAYRVAARNLARSPIRLDALFAEGHLRDINGVGPALEAKIVEYLSTGWLTAADVLNARPLSELRAVLAARRPRETVAE